MNNIKASLLMLLAIILLIANQACEKMEDTYAQYLEGGEIIYPGKADSLQAFPGNKRIALKWLIVSDPKVVKAVVYWNNRADSVEVPIQKTAEVDTISVVLPNMEEGLYTFDVYTYDNQGHRSIGSQVIGEVYGDTFQQTISNRLIRSVEWFDLPQEGEIPAFMGAQINWYGVNMQAVFMDIRYTQENGSVTTIREEPVRISGRPPLFRETTRLPNGKKNSAIMYRTAFMPDTLAIDTFYTEYSTYTPISTQE
ncbi:DUF4998 domain-containing protein [Parapedobacter deserti]|uniref:DUF4998 domain-containing protein n=1 Tax=Parapedobacter deserti TaxID=1912957 RepID=A0ABV7JF07_9SPHI